jgi:hypothetical protein
LSTVRVNLSAEIQAFLGIYDFVEEGPGWFLIRTNSAARIASGKFVPALRRAAQSGLTLVEVR